jgi:hypothetical protein
MPKPQKIQPLVTKQWLTDKVKENPERTIGRALVAIFHYQTADERADNETKLDNGVGFSANDARLGCIGAKYFMKHETLSPGLMKGWLKPDKWGMPRITKYTKQLNKIAIEKSRTSNTHRQETTPA